MNRRRKEKLVGNIAEPGFGGGAPESSDFSANCLAPQGGKEKRDPGLG